MNRLILFFAVALCASACGGRKPQPLHVDTSQQRVFLPAIAPAHLAPAEQQEYLRWHYWDRFNFADTLFTTEADSTQIFEAYVHYVALLSMAPTDGRPMDSLMLKASASRKMLDYFATLGERVLHDPNSPLRNDELYIPILRSQLASPYYDKYEKIAPAYDLKMALQNRLGQPANDFRYTLASGKTGTLYGIKADYVLLMLYNPGCAMCQQIREEIGASQVLSTLIAAGKLRVVALYTDEELQAWRDYLPQIPANWINGYDANYILRDKSLYNLQAIPALYLLDADKRVLVKDSTDIPLIEGLVSNQI